MEVGGEGERGKDVEERGEGEGRDGATVVIGHDALDRAVVSDSGVAKLHGLHCQPRTVTLLSGLVGRGRIRVGDVEVEVTHDCCCQ